MVLARMGLSLAVKAFFTALSLAKPHSERYGAETPPLICRGMQQQPGVRHRAVGWLIFARSASVPCSVRH
jgi:hypothetical protein